MKKCLFTVCIALVSANLSAQITLTDSVVGGGYVERSSGLNWMSYLLAPSEATQEFVLKESLQSSPSCYGYIYINEDMQTGAVCYLPKSLWHDKDSQTPFLENDNNWIPIAIVPKRHPEFLGRNYDRLYIEHNANGSQVFGYWYFDKITTDDFIVYHGTWTNGKNFGGGFKSYYIQFL
jgi:hypothetical protein